MSRLSYPDVRHDCDVPDTSHLPDWESSDRSYYVFARWRCPVCRQRWWYGSKWSGYNRLSWHREDGPGWRWKRAERRRLAAQERGTS